MDRRLVGQAMNGDHEAFAVLAAASIDRLYASARLILHDEQRAEDATQEALVAAWRDLPALRDPGRFDAWLHRLLVRACYREARRERGRRIREIHVPALAEDPHRVDDDLADRDELERGFRRLDTEQRAALVLHHSLGLPLSELALALGVPEGTAKSRLHRATERMRAALEADARPGLVLGGPVA